MRFASAVMLSIALSPAANADSNALAPPVEKCIRDNAAQVEAAIPDLNQAVDYLVTDLCAAPIAAELARQSKQDADERQAAMKEKCDKPESQGGYPHKMRELMCSYYSDVALDFSGGTVLFNHGTNPPDAVGLASRLLLDLRLAHLNKSH